MQQCRLARPRRPEEKHSLGGGEVQVKVADGPIATPRMAPAPAVGGDGGAAGDSRLRGHHASWLRCPTLPDSNRLNAPVFASPLTTYQDSSPAMTMPEMIAATV